MILQIISLILACFILTWLNSRLIKNLTSLAKYFGIKEFVVAFFVLGISVNLPNLFVDVGAALQGFPQIAIGDMIGGNLIDLTLVLAIGAFFAKRHISTDSKMVQGSALFTFFIAIFPLFLLLKGEVTRLDGLVLIAIFCIYTAWSFSKDDRFKKEFTNPPKIKKSKIFVIIFQVIAILALLFFVSQQIIAMATLVAGQLGASLSLVSLLIVAMANCFPEMYLTILSIRKGQNWLVLGDLMSSIIGAATLVFGIVALVHPFVIADVSQLLIARSFLVIAALFFLITIKTGKKITKREGLLLLFIYLFFLLSEVFIQL